MIQNEFEEIVKKFNEDKIKNNWLTLLTVGANHGWEVFKSKIINYPDYYDFKTAREFKFWLSHSEDIDFVIKRFCPICNTFITEVKDTSTIYPVACCREHINKARQLKIEQTNLKLYGTKSAAKSEKIKEKIKQTNLKKYGVEYPLQSKEIYDKTIEACIKNDSYTKGYLKGKQTRLEKYGDENYNNSEQISETKLNKTIEEKQDIYNKVKQTKLLRYADENYNNSNKIKQTCIEKYGVDNCSKDENIKNKIAKNSLQARINNNTTQKELVASTELKYNGKTYKDNFISKVYKTKKENGTLNTSHSFEDKFILYLKEKYPQYTILTQYNSDPRYPYCCDCYIKELDLFIEFQGIYFHNYRPFVESEEHIKEYLKMIECGGLNANIANVWRYKDPLKRQIARDNKLNFLEYWEKSEENDIYDPIERWQALQEKNES